MEIIIFFILLACGYGFGRYAEKKHYQSIIAREKELNRLPVIASKVLPITNKLYESNLVAGNVVISIDYFKQMIPLN